MIFIIHARVARMNVDILDIHPALDQLAHQSERGKTRLVELFHFMTRSI